MIQLAPSPFEQWAAEQNYDLTKSSSPSSNRTYFRYRTQDAYEAWQAGAASVARMLTESTLDTPALREKIRELAGSNE